MLGQSLQPARISFTRTRNACATASAAPEYGNRQEFINEVLAPFGARFGAGKQFRPVRIRSIHVDGDTVIVVWDGSGLANDGLPYDNTYAWVMRMGEALDHGVGVNIERAGCTGHVGALAKVSVHGVHECRSMGGVVLRQRPNSDMQPSLSESSLRWSRAFCSKQAIGTCHRRSSMVRRSRLAACRPAVRPQRRAPSQNLMTAVSTMCRGENQAVAVASCADPEESNSAGHSLRRAARLFMWLRKWPPFGADAGLLVLRA